MSHLKQNNSTSKLGYNRLVEVKKRKCENLGKQYRDTYSQAVIIFSQFNLKDFSRLRR